MTESYKPPRFTQGSIMRHVINMTVTSGLGLTFTFLIEALTLFWLARLGDETIIAAMTIAGGVVFFNISLAVAMMIPAIALVSRALGRGDRKKARTDASASLVIAVGFQLLLVLLFLSFIDPLLLLIGGDGSPEALAIAKSFLRISVASLPVFAIAMTASALLRAEGDGKRSMFVTLLGGVIAMVLDPLFIIFMDWGVVGAAWVSVLARFGMAALGLYYLIRLYDLLAPIREISIRVFILPFAAIALPALLTQLSSPIGNIILIRFMGQFGQADLAAFGAVFRLLTLTFGGIFALSGAVGGIIGQNYGAGHFERVRETYVKAILFGTVYTLIAWLLLNILRPFVPAMFGLSAEGTDIVNHFVYTSIYFVFVSMLFVSNAAFNNLGRPLWSTGFNWLRDIVLTLPVAYILCAQFGALGVIYTMVVLGIIVGGASALVGWNFLGRVGRGEIIVEKYA